MLPADGALDLSGLLAQAQAMQAQMVDAQARLSEARVTGSAGGGLVTAVASGTGELLALQISAEVVDPSDTETLADLVLAAVRDAATQAGALQAESMSPVSQGLSDGPLGGILGAGPGPLPAG